MNINKEDKVIFLKNNFIVIENFLEKEILDCVEKIDLIEEWNDPNKGFLDRQKNNNKNKYEIHENYSTEFVPTSNRFVANINEMNFYLKQIMDVFRSEEFISHLRYIFDLDDIFLDESLRGGGLQKSGNGAFLRLHVDNNWNFKTQCYPIVNVILFLSEWKKNYGGELEIWNEYNKITSIEPQMNKLVIRKNSEDSYHGFPKPIQCPANYSRLALVLFYYTKIIEPANKRTSALWL